MSNLKINCTQKKFSSSSPIFNIIILLWKVKLNKDHVFSCQFTTDIILASKSLEIIGFAELNMFEPTVYKYYLLDNFLLISPPPQFSNQLVFDISYMSSFSVIMIHGSNICFSHLVFTSSLVSLLRRCSRFQSLGPLHLSWIGVMTGVLFQTFFSYAFFCNAYIKTHITYYVVNVLTTVCIAYFMPMVTNIVSYSSRHIALSSRAVKWVVVYCSFYNSGHSKKKKKKYLH